MRDNVISLKVNALDHFMTITSLHLSHLPCFSVIVVLFPEGEHAVFSFCRNINHVLLLEELGVSML